jgi:hypothetical protein
LIMVMESNAEEEEEMERLREERKMEEMTIL